MVMDAAAGQSVAAPRGRRKSAAAEPQEVPDYCARPACRRQFARTIGPGRPQAFCSDLCRRTAEKEVRQLRSKLTHFEGVVTQLKADLAAFSRGVPSDSDTEVVGEGDRRSAEDAVTRVEGVLTFLADSSDPLAQELRNLHDAVAPVIKAS